MVGEHVGSIVGDLVLGRLKGDGMGSGSWSVSTLEALSETWFGRLKGDGMDDDDGRKRT